jgi:hypothetical protein
MNDLPNFIDPSFEELFYSAVDKAMLLLGESGRQAAFYHIEKTFGLRKECWHMKPEKFAEAVEAIFGPGAQLLLRAIVRELYSSIGLKYNEQKDFRFVQLLRKAKRHTSQWGGEFN